MNKIVVLTSAIMLFCAPAHAQALMSPAYIQQIETGRAAASISTSDMLTPLVNLISEARAMRPTGPAGLALVWQEGRNNAADIDQSGSRNIGLIRQIGMDNVASITQRGSGHHAFVSQQGHGNVAIIRQR